MSHIEPVVPMNVDTGHQDVIPGIDKDPTAQELHNQVKPSHHLSDEQFLYLVVIIFRQMGKTF